MTAAEQVARTRLTQGAWVVRLSRRDRPPSFDVDLADSESAQLASDGGVQGLFAGLLHNQEELSQVLGLEAGTTDAAIVVAGYRRWGEALLGRLEGVFAIVVWDDEAEALLAVRDPLGSYPLFYAEGGGGLYVSNVIDALLVQPGVPDDVNIPALADHLRHRWPRADETYFEAVHRIPPGHALRQSRNGRRVWRHWDPAPSGAVDWIDADDLDQFDALFDRAVTRALGHGQAGIFLSGGLDSVSVAAVAAASCRRDGLPDPWALSLAFPDPESNEEPRQRAVAAALEIPQVMLAWRDAVPQDGLLRSALELTANSPAPLVNLWMPAYDRLALEGKARGCAVILTGGGGDEWLSVSPYYAADLLRVLDVRGLHNIFFEHRRSHRISSLQYLRNMLWRFGVRALLVDAAERTLGPSVLRRVKEARTSTATPDWIAPDPSLRRTLHDRSAEASLSPQNGQGHGRRHPRFYIREMRSSLDHPLVAMELEELFEQGRRVGVRVHQPFWDASLVEFLYRTPPELLNRGGRAKGLVRETVARRFPGLGFESQLKVTATGLVRSLLLTEGREMWRRLGGAATLAEAGVVDPIALDERVESIDERASRAHVIWDVLALESWLRAR